MPRKAKKAPARRKSLKKKAIKATSKRAPARKQATPKSTARKSSAKNGKAKRGGALARLESALLMGVAEVDELAVDMGLSGAVEPRPKPRRSRR